MDEVLTLLTQLKISDKDKDHENVIQKTIQLVCDLNEEDNDNKENIFKALMNHEGMKVILSHLTKTNINEDESLLTNVAQLLAELAKSESLREPLVSMGVVPHLLSHLSSQNIALATQACRALGNICFDNDPGRLAVDKEDGITIIMKVLSNHLNNTQEGAARLRVIVCGFLLNLTNNCDQLQERAVDTNVLCQLNDCISAHLEDNELTNMALLTIGSITESDAGKEAAVKSGLLDTFKQLLDQTGNNEQKDIIVDLLGSLMESETAKDIAADNGLYLSLVNIVNSETQSPEIIKMASDVLVSILVGDQSMEKLYMSGDGALLAQSVEWLSSDKDTLKTLGTLAIGNFARRDAYCQHLVEMGIVDKLISILKTNVTSESSFMLHHAVLSSLRNLAIPVANKPKLLEAGVLEICLSLIHTDVMAVIFKLLGVLRMLIEGQESAAIKLGQDRTFLDCLSEWCGVEAHAGVKGEATRVMASLVKNSRSTSVIQNLIRADGINHLVSMAMSEHLVMQNEAILALTIICTTALGEASVPLKEADLTETLIILLKDDKLPAEMMCNVFSLLQAISTSATPSVPPSCALLACTGLMPDVRRTLKDDILTSNIVDLVRSLGESHMDERVKDAARSTVLLLEQSMSCT
ncbi:rap1 GTPase-GDP dissociation stimulator 1-like isoform X2 [Biomphalaria glabrata]|uniref:Rap1 GTPase-GDP dissociation stimulator 1-like isoform X2 n=1 Tax=Biomphalaria glabrata TaxID=6526 RepID=A0A9W2ZQY1_BIOGL|nr:rap1 GTPase-GDP dissociation stimulator 1-like isoform X2 [Biomphalaria glabrata]